MNEYQALPRIELEAGETQTLDFHLFNSNGVQLDASDKTVRFFLFDYINRSDNATVTKTASIETPSEDVPFARVFLSQSDTNELLGKYIYQLNISSEIDNAVEILQGTLIVHRSAKNTI